MKNILTLLAFLPISAYAQVTHLIEAGGSTAPGSTTPPFYAPAEWEIMVNDSVRWIGVSGTHNVYGELDDFPQNPEGFSSGEPDNDLDFTFGFTIPGVYMYHCTQQGHSQTQQGMITVVDNTNVEEQTVLGALSLYPMPTSGQLTIELNGGSLRAAEVMGVDGRMYRTQNMIAGQRNVMDVSGLAHGRYLLRVLDTRGNSLVRSFVKE